MIPGTPGSSGSHHYVPQTISSCSFCPDEQSFQFVAEQMSPERTISVYNLLTYLMRPKPTLCPQDTRHMRDPQRQRMKCLRS